MGTAILYVCMLPSGPVACADVPPVPEPPEAEGPDVAAAVASGAVAAIVVTGPPVAPATLCVESELQLIKIRDTTWTHPCLLRHRKGHARKAAAVLAEPVFETLLPNLVNSVGGVVAAAGDRKGRENSDEEEAVADDFHLVVMMKCAKQRRLLYHVDRLEKNYPRVGEFKHVEINNS